MVTVRTPRWVEAPTGGRPLPFGLFSVPDVVQADADPHTGMGGVQYQTVACGDLAHTSVEACVTGSDADLVDDDGFGIVTADAFTVYALHRCRNVAAPDPALAAAQKLDLGAERAVELAFLQRFKDRDLVDVTPVSGTGVPIEVGLGLLEEYAGIHYGKAPTIHTPRSAATSMNAKGLLVQNGTHLETKLGSYVSAGGGYALEDTVGLDDAGDPPDVPATISVTAGTGERWLWLTGDVVANQGPIEKHGPTYGLASPDNEHFSLASQRYSVTSECLLAAVLVTFPGGG